jgi:putative spermidine/putrescine transport system ATP-binding protein
MGYRNILSLHAESVAADVATVVGEGVKLVGTVAGPVAVGDAVQVAVRPEDLKIASGDAEVAFEAVAEVVEYHGREFQVDALNRAGKRVHLRTPERVAPGDRLSLTVDPQRALVFPAESGDGE